MTKPRNEFRDVLPLGIAAFHILLALADGERHGYAISKEIAALTNGALELGPGTLYRVIKQSLADGWIDEVEAPPGDEDQRRRYYRLSALGRRIACAEAKRLADLVGLARTRRLLPA